MTVQTDTERLSDLKAMVTRGNHKSAQKPANLLALRKNIEKEIRHQYLIPTTVNSISKLKGATVNPLGVSEQYSINSKGQKILKPRTCHDASFPAISGYSVNLDHDMTLLTDCIYGQCLRRIIHSIHRARIAYPDTVILLFKYDLDSAYRRLHVCSAHVVKSITVVDDRAYILVRLPFGARCGPSVYSDVSESIFDLANDILHDTSWNPNDLHSPHKHILQPPEFAPPNEPFSRAKPLAINIPLRETMTDGYIDDAITFAVQLASNILRVQNALPLSVYTIFKPASPTESDIRADPLSLRKLQGDSTPSEEKLVLGWLLNTLSLSIHLPLDKAQFWITEIKQILRPQYRVKSKQIESTIGRLNHIGYILPHARYFLNRTRKLFKRCNKYGPQLITKAEHNDFLLWIKFIERAAQRGVHFNLISVTKWDIGLYTDACQTGLGGYNPTTGIAWRLKLDKKMTTFFHINVLEFIAAKIGIWIELIHTSIEHPRILCLTDNSCSVGWLTKSNFDPDRESHHDTVTRSLATLLLDHDAALYPQHVKGTNNIIADSISRDFHLPNKVLEFCLSSLYPSQTPKGLKILTILPNEITSWVASLMDGMTSTQALPQAPKNSNMGVLLDGKTSWTEVVSRINSWTTSVRKQESASCPLLHQLFVEMKEAKQTKLFCQDKPYVKQSTMFVRSLEQTFGGLHI